MTKQKTSRLRSQRFGVQADQNKRSYIHCWQHQNPIYYQRLSMVFGVITSINGLSFFQLQGVQNMTEV